MHASKFTKFKFIVRDARVFPGIWFDFIYPHNSSLFLATPQIYIAADYNTIYCPALRQTFTTHADKVVTDRQTKFVNKHFITVLSVRLI